MNLRTFARALLLALPTIVSAENMFGEVLAKTPELSMLYKLYQVDRALFDVLEDPVDLTYFAPSDEAMTEFLRVTRGSSDYLTNKATRYRVFKDLFYYMTIKGSYRNRELFETPKILETYLENKIYHTSRERKTQVALSVEKDSVGKVYGGQNFGIQILKPDISFGSGFIHVVDGFFKMPLSFSATADALGYEDWLDYVDAVDMRKLIDDTPTSTIFIPAVDAKKVPPTNSTELRELIQYHIIEGRAFFSSELTKRTTRVETVNGEKIYLSLKDKGLYVNNARVVKSDIITVSGVIHVLDRPLDNSQTTVTDTQGKKCNCVGQYCVDTDGYPCKVDARNMPNKGNTALGTSDEVFEVDAGATSNSPIYAGALAALTAIFYCIMG